MVTNDERARKWTIAANEAMDAAKPLGLALMAVADAEQAELRAEVERLWAVIHDVADGEGWTTQIGGALISKCDIYGRTEQHIRAKAAEAKVARVEALHRPSDAYPEDCAHCEAEWPCPTAEALTEGGDDRG